MAHTKSKNNLTNNSCKHLKIINHLNIQKEEENSNTLWYLNYKFDTVKCRIFHAIFFYDTWQF